MRPLRTAFAAAIVFGCSVAPAAAQEPTALQRMLGNFGLLQIPSDDPIDYRERSPLVVPPSSELPLPNATPDVAAAVPDWPTDPEVVAARKRAEEARRPVDPRRDAFYSGRRLTPQEMRRGTARNTTAGNALTTERYLAPEREPQKSPGILSRLWGRGEEEKPIQFAGEPPRRSLADPPPGYLTPSPSAPYGVVQKDKPGKQRPFDPLALPDDPINTR